MRNLRSVIFGLGYLLGGAFLANYFGAEVGAQQRTVTEAQSKRSGLWKAEDCKKISDASGLFLYVAGERIKRTDKLKKKGKRQRLMNLMRVHYLHQNWLQITKNLLKLIANRHFIASFLLSDVKVGRSSSAGLVAKEPVEETLKPASFSDKSFRGV